MPTVSVVIPTHNRPDLVGRAIRSALGQTLQDLEVIVVDDGLAARAEATVRAIGDARIRYIAHESERGGPAARNTGIRAATGRYIALLDDDDEWLPHKLEAQVAALESCDEDVPLAFCGVSAFSTDGRRLYTKLPHRSGAVEVHRQLLYRCFIWTSSILLRASAVEQLGATFDEALKKNQEWDLVLRLSQRHRLFAINEPLTKLHILGEDEHLGGSGNLPNIITGFEQLLAKHLDDYRAYPQALALRRFQLGLMYRDAGRFSEARRSLLQAWRLQPAALRYLRHAAVALAGRRGYRVSATLGRLLSPRRLLEGGRLAYRAAKRVPGLGRMMQLARDAAYRSPIERRLLRRRDFTAATELLSELFPRPQVERCLAEAKAAGLFSRRFSVGHSGDFDIAVLYISTRLTQPTTVVETGVASGRSSTAILEALHRNGHGHLYSIDLPQFYSGQQPGTYRTAEGNDELLGFIPAGREVGWLVPAQLRGRWTLTLGDSRDELPKLIAQLGQVDTFYHDSDHSYDSMTFEYRTVWPALRHAGFLFSDDVRWNDAWKDFTAAHPDEFTHAYRSFGTLRRYSPSGTAPWPVADEEGQR